jgi:hypothetical protein
VANGAKGTLIAPRAKESKSRIERISFFIWILASTFRHSGSWNANFRHIGSVPTSFCYRVYINSYLADAWVPKNCLAMICMRPLSFVPSMAARHSRPDFLLDFSFDLALVQRLLQI